MQPLMLVIKFVFAHKHFTSVELHPREGARPSAFLMQVCCGVPVSSSSFFTCRVESGQEYAWRAQSTYTTSRERVQVLRRESIA